MGSDLRIPGIGLGLRKLRERHGLSLAQLAEKADCDRTRLSKYETGVNSVSLEFLEQIARALDMSKETVVLFCLNERYQLEGTDAWKLMNELCSEVREALEEQQDED